MFEARKSRAAVFAVAATLAVPVLGLASPVSAVGATPAPIANLRATLHDPGSGGNSDYFGVSVATSATDAFVAAPGTNGFAGAVYVYTKRSGAWPTTPTVTLHDPAASTGDLFGASIAVSGNTAVIGASGGAGSGIAYIYVKGAAGWPTAPTATLFDPAGTVNDRFGFSVAASRSTVVVGAWGANAQAGAAYIYEKGRSGWPTIPTAKLADPAAHTNDRFGLSVAVAGTTATVAAEGTDGGGCFPTVYIYARNSAGWPTTPATNVTDPRGSCAFGSFGVSMALSKSTMVVGAVKAAGAVFIYGKSATGLPTTPIATLTDPAPTGANFFGQSAALSRTTAVVGAYNTNAGAGASYIYKKGNTWPVTPTLTLPDPAATANDSFGQSVAVQDSTAIIGAPSNAKPGLAYIFEI